MDDSRKTQDAIDEYVERLVADAPPLTDTQVAALRDLLRPVEPPAD